MKTLRKPARILPEKLIRFFLNRFNAPAAFFAGLRVNPNLLTVLSLLAGAAAGALFALRKPVWAGVAIAACGVFDILDGKVADRLNRKSLYGAIFDSTLDRYSEFFIYLGLAYYFRHSWALWIPILTFLGSFMVSYTRARAEGLGIECRVGFMQRAERMVLLLSASILGTALRIFDAWMIISLAAIALISNFTAVQRTLHVKKIERLMKTEKEV